MANRLPDETISEILSPLLKFSDTTFADASPKPLVSNYSSSTYLLVCRTWCRVATPLLYKTVVLRTTAQADTLGRFLLFNNSLGLFIRKLRIEGGFGQAMRTVLEYAVNVTDLFVSLSIWSFDNVAGLCNGLLLINPRRVIVADETFKTNKQATRIVEALVDLIPKWGNLEIIHFPCYTTYFQPNDGRTENFVVAMTQSKTLRILIIYPTYDFQAGHRSDVEIPPRIAEIPGLRVLEFKTHPQLTRAYNDYYFSQAKKSIQTNSKLRQLARFPLEEASIQLKLCATPSLNPFFIPMKSASPEIREAFWKRVLFFAMVVEKHPSASSLLSYVLVSKAFKNMGLPYLYRSVDLQNFVTVESLARQIEAHPILGSYIRYLRISSGPRILALSILARTDSLQKFGGVMEDVDDPAHIGRRTVATDISFTAFQMLGKTSGASLLQLSASVGSFLSASTRRPVDEDPAVWSYFTELRFLGWDSTTNFKTKRDPSLAGALGNLESLCIELCPHSLNSLRRVCLSTAANVSAAIRFLKVHGSKLVRLEAPIEILAKLRVFVVCPNLYSLVVLSHDTTGKAERRAIPPDFVLCEVPQNSLVKVLFKFNALEKKNEIACNETFGTLNSTFFPALREIQFSCCQWPMTEHEISNNRWIHMSDLLHQKNVRLTDANGFHWEPRASSSRK
ncbi:hypothetical protein B0H10DRAFT_1978024 [Mycena sp. CBHHK59/15]|nr:hypothetical protein B0H10DRAFT_1978024 [Mycena sp. CBHHK59/15]